MGTVDEIKDRKEWAARIRQRFYARKPEAVPNVEPGGASPRPVTSRTIEKPGRPCPKGNNSLVRKALSMAKILASQDVPDEVYEERMAACRACAYSTKARGHHWCGCCGCPQWNLGWLGSSLEYKCRKAAFECTRPEPAFGRWEVIT